jgi:hypothetical protein
MTMRSIVRLNGMNDRVSNVLGFAVSRRPVCFTSAPCLEW